MKKKEFENTINKIRAKNLNIKYKKILENKYIRNTIGKFSANVCSKCPDILSELNYVDLENIYLRSRKDLYKNNFWRRGTNRIHSIFSDIYEKFTKYQNISGKTFLELGSGFHPYGIASVMYLNGVKEAYSVEPDLLGDDYFYASCEALLNLIINCKAYPDHWLVNEKNISLKEYFDKLDKFDIRSLIENDIEKSTNNVPITFFKEKLIEEVDLPANSVDLLASRAVLEHIFDFENAMNKMYEMMAPSGIMYHFIDFSDHKAYFNPKKYNKFGLLTLDKSWSDDFHNRLRPIEMKEVIIRSGFNILEWDSEIDEIPTSIENKIHTDYKKYPVEDLKTVRVKCVLQK